MSFVTMPHVPPPRRTGVALRALRLATALFFRGWLKGYHRLRIVGRENLPASGPFVLVANHASHLDVVCLLAALPLGQLGRAFPTASADYFFASLPKRFVSSLLFNGLPLHRTGGAGSAAAVRDDLHQCRQALISSPDGGIVILFPEGSRSLDGELHPFKRGVGVLVAGTDVPVIPCRLEGTFGAMPKGRKFPRPRRIRLTIGAAHRYAGRHPGKDSARRIADDLHHAVAALPPGGTAATLPPHVDPDDEAVTLAA